MVTFIDYFEFMKVYKSLFPVVFILMISCGEDDPAPVDLFAGDYTLVNVIEEHDPNNNSEKFLAPDVYVVTKTEFLDPTTGNRIAAYKYEDDTRFIGMMQSATEVLVGTDNCPNSSDLNGASITFSGVSSLYTLNMRNCEGREVIAEYTLD